MLKAVVGTVSACAALAMPGCGDSGPAGSLDKPLAYFPADAGAVAVVSTDLDSGRYSELNGELGKKMFDGKGLEEGLSEAVDESEMLSWEDDIEPLLGNYMVAGAPSRHALVEQGVGAAVAVLHVRDEGKLRDLLEGKTAVDEDGEADGVTIYRIADVGWIALDDDVAVFASTRQGVVASLAEADRSGHLTEALFDAATTGQPKDDAILRFYGDVRGLFDDFRIARFASVPWAQALRTVGATISIDGERLVLDAAANTDPGAVTERDLPLIAGHEPPQLADVPGRITSGSANQSQTTVFLLRLFRSAFPRSRFVRDVAAIERDLHIDFEREVLRQFDGPSASELDLAGGFAARSTVRDPERLRALLPRLAPHLPRLVEDLDGLRGTGRALLLLFAPDAPVATTASSGGVRIGGGRGGRLYRLSGLKGEGPDQIFMGLVGDVFVVASDEERAREIAVAPLEPPPAGTRGAAVAQADFAEVAPGRLSERLGIDSRSFGKAFGWLEASTARVRAHAELELRFGRP